MGNNEGEESERHSTELKGRNISTYNFIHSKNSFFKKSKKKKQSKDICRHTKIKEIIISRYTSRTVTGNLSSRRK